MAIVGENALIIQRPNRGLLELDSTATQQRWKDKPPTKESVKLVKEYGHLLGAKERRLVERGIHKLTTEKLVRLLGPASPEIGGKLAAIRGALVIGENYGLALDPVPTVIPFHDVSARLAAMRKSNAGKPVRVLRNGMLLRVLGGTHKGTWFIRSIVNDSRDGIVMDLSEPHMIPFRERGKTWCRRNARLKGILEAGLEILPRRYSGYPQEK